MESEIMLDDKPKVSFIIPVYNGEGFIKRCLSSVLSQSYSNIEVIIVNDGSKDNTMNICDIFAQKDVRITAIHTENKGVSSARNLGLSKCTGSLIHFLDCR
jgi:Glycosyltransferases involved in cell wall biogenesis